MIDKILVFGILYLQFVQMDCKKVDERFSQFHCYKHQICTSGGEKVCGYDEKAAVLAYFNDICILHLANCNRAGFYRMVDMTACDAKYNYTVTFQDELQFEKILRNTIAPSTVPNKDVVRVDLTKGDPSKEGTKGDTQKSTTKNLDETFIRVGKNTESRGLVGLLNGDIRL